MTSKNALMRGAALVAVLAFAAGANARPVHHKKASSYGEAAPPASQSAEVAQLRREVAELKALVQSQAQNQAQSQATLSGKVDATEARVTEVAANAEAVQAQLDSVPQQVLTTVGELPKPKPSWAERTQVTGRVFFDFSGIEQKSNGVRVAPSGTAFDIKRFYIGVDHQFNDIYSANLTTDFQYSSAVGATELYIKKAYVQAKYLPWLTLRAGAADMPWVPFVEELYGFRYVEKTLIDYENLGTSTDWGIHALGSFDPLGSPSGPVVSYALSVVNGTGFKAPPGTGSAPRTDTLDVEARVSARWRDWTIGIGGYRGRLGKDAGAAFNAPAGILTYRDASRFNAVVAYTAGSIRAGAEYVQATNWTAVTNKTSGEKADSYAVFGSYQFQPEWTVFGRYDYAKPAKTTAPTKRSDYFNIGLQYEPVKVVDFSLVYKRDKVDNGTFSTGNGIIGGSHEGAYDEIGIFGQFRW